jgi:hypothetical protein
MIEILARGTVPDGRSFDFQMVEAAGVQRLVRIRLH